MPPAAPKEKKLFFGKGFLRAAFCCAVLGSGMAPAQTAPESAPPAENDNKPQTIVFFNHAAEKSAHSIFSDGEKKWNEMIVRQDLLIKNPYRAALFKDFIAPLKNRLETEQNTPLLEKARIVNDLVQAKISYTFDKDIYKVEDYWAAPLETLTKKRGDCEDLALLKYYILRALDVPADRLYIAMVSNNPEKLDHAVLLMNVAEAGTKFIILDSARKGLAAANESDYVFFSAVNETGFWWHPEVRETLHGLVVTYQRNGDVHEVFIDAEHQKKLLEELKGPDAKDRRGEELVSTLLSKEQDNIIRISAYKNSVYEGIFYYRHVEAKNAEKPAQRTENKLSSTPDQPFKSP